MLENHDIICFAPTDWWGMNPSCTTHIMRNLAKANRVIYINPVSSDLLGVKKRKGFLIRICRKAKSLLKFSSKINHNLYVVSPWFLPFQGIRPIDAINNLMLKIQLRLIMFFLKIKHPILWAENIRCADIIPSFSWKLIVYHVSDVFDQCPYTSNKAMLKKRDDYITRKSDLLVCVSTKLYESKKNINPNVCYLPHGVDFSFFREHAERKDVYQSLKDIPKPIAGYFGTLTAQNDIDILEYCAAHLPDIHFVFAGRITAGDYSKLMAMKNVTFLGNVDYQQIPKLCSMFDVCLLPWKMTNWIENCNPLKLFEYMASGKPIVSVPIPEVAANYSDVVSIAGDKHQFCRAIKWELQYDTEQRREKRIALAFSHSWENQNNHLSDIIQAALEKRGA